MRLALMLLSLLLAGCVTPYQETGFLGGVEAHKLGPGTYRILAKGNGYSTGALMHDYAMLKAAETTRDAGGTYFVIENREDTTAVSYVPMQYGAVRVSAPGKQLDIRVYTVAPGKPPPPTAYSVDEIVKSVGARVKPAT